MQSFAVVDDRAAYLPLHGFTSADLGYETGDAVSNMVSKLDEAPMTAQYVQLFDQIWNNPDQLEDVTDIVHDHIASVYAENSPERIYFLILYNLFADFLDEVNEDVLPNDRTGYQDTAIWNALYDFQRDAAIGAINKLETFNGCILADSVGLGKTFTALAVIKYYELRNKSVLVLAPKKLAENWTNYNGNYTTNIFAGDRLNYDVLAHTDLSRHKGESLGMRLDRVNWGNYDLVVIDESHNFRNADYAEEKESRYQRLMRQVMREGVQTKVLMLSATPVNNRFYDLKNQLQLAYEGESDNLARHLNLSSTVEKVFSDAQRAFNEWSKLPADQRTAGAILDMLDFDFFELLDAVTIARSRKHIQAFYDMTEIGAFPERRLPISKRTPLTDLPDVLSFNEIFEQLQLLNLSVYTPLAYVFPSRMAKYEQMYNAGSSGSRANLGQSGREQGLKQLMTVNLLKRLESSVQAFRLTLGKIESAADGLLTKLDSHDESITDLDVDVADLDADDDEAEAELLAYGDKIRIDLADVDVESWRRDLWHDRETLRELLEVMRRVTPEHDLKLVELKRLVLDKAANPINVGNQKVLIFSAFADTADYLYRELVPAVQTAGLDAALVTGGGHGGRTTLGAGYDFQQVLTLFSPRSKQRDLTMPTEVGEIDVLIGTDCISEGQNLQDCDYLVNYDIHWNPVRIIQRFGRIDRIGSTNAEIQLVNFWPDITLDEYINLKERVENRMVIADLAATADDNVLTQESSDTAFRREQLRRLQDEVIELEDVRTGVSITDLGLNDFRMDLLGYVEEYGDPSTAPKGLHAVVTAQPDKGLQPGVLFALRNVNADEHINRGNRLHPHYLVYLDDSGSVIADHTEVKHLLDLIRAGCRGVSEPIADVCRIFNEATNDGSDMAPYSELLTSAIRSMIDVTDEQDLDSLFTAGGTTALTQTIAGLDDFELIAFLAIVAPDEVAHTVTVSTLYRWPASAHFGRGVPKTKFYEHGTITKAVRDKFVAEVQRITWAYKLADATIHLSATEDVPEIQIFVIDAKTEDVSDAVLTAIDKAVRMPIIFEINRGQGPDETARMTATHKQATVTLKSTASYYSTDWIPADAERSALPTAINLPALYGLLISPLLPIDPRPGERLADTAVRIADARKLDREIASIERRLRNEPQFNRKVELRRELRDRTAALDALTSPTRSDTDDAVGKEARWTS